MHLDVQKSKGGVDGRFDGKLLENEGEEGLGFGST